MRWSDERKAKGASDKTEALSFCQSGCAGNLYQHSVSLSAWDGGSCDGACGRHCQYRKS
ncbi:TPA: hypothetical protein P5Q08_003879, partial [Clostridioides difficile]|nr:hypothetical protein [Clostridioides difficile]